MSPDPRPKIPSGHAEFMSTAVPDKYSQTRGGGGYLILFRDWIDDDLTQSMVICLSGFGAHILCNHPVWLCDGTFKSTPDPFKQVKSKLKIAQKVNIYFCSRFTISWQNLSLQGVQASHVMLSFPRKWRPI